MVGACWKPPSRNPDEKGQKGGIRWKCKTTALISPVVKKGINFAFTGTTIRTRPASGEAQAKIACTGPARSL